MPTYDIFALGMTIFALVTLRLPDIGTPEPNRNKFTYHDTHPLYPTSIDGLPSSLLDTLWALLGEMWAEDPTRRPTSEVVAVRLEGILNLLTASTNSAS